MYAKILVPLDGSERSQQALCAAREMATAFGSQILLLVALDLQGALFVKDDDQLPTDYRKLKEHQRHRIAGYLRERQEELEGLLVSVLMREEDAAEAILAVAEEEAVDLILMTSHGSSGWTRWISGSVAERVLRRAPCPVLILRQGRPPVS